MLKFEKVATPFTAATPVVPESTPAPGFAPIATVTVPVKLVTTFHNASSALTASAGVIVAPASVLLGGTVNTSWLTGPGVTVTLAVCVTATPLIVADTVFDSATVELTAPVATPLAFVVAAGCVRVLPVPLAASTTVAPTIGLPLASFAVTVMVEVPLPAVIGDVAVTVDCAAETEPTATLKPLLVGDVSAPEVATSV